ncbi:MAG: ABC transporter substrate-binding protein [Variovorax sp.]
MSITKKLAASALIVLAAGLGTSAQAQPAPTRIGLNVERTGPIASYGLHAAISAQLAVDEINKAGGVNGAPLELVVEDNRSSPEQAVIATRNLADKGVVAMLGPVTTTVARTAFPAANRAQLPTISPGSGLPGLTAQNRPWTFRNSALDMLIIDELIRRLKQDHPGVKNVVAVLDPKDPYANFLIKNVAPPILEKNGLTIVNAGALIEVPSDVTDFSVFITRVKALNPDVVFVGLLHEAVPAFLKEAHRQRLKVPMFAGLGTITEGVSEAAKDIEVYSGQPFDSGADDPKVQAYVKEFRARSEKQLPGQYSTPIYADAGAYESVYLFADAIRAGKIDAKTDVAEARTRIRDYLAKVKDFKGLGNTLYMNAEGDAVKNSLIFRTQGGAWKRF